MSKFLDLINKQRSEKKEEKFEGTFLEYLEKLQQDSDIAKPAHKRLYDAIKQHGVNKMDNEDPRKKVQPLPRYDELEALPPRRRWAGQGCGDRRQEGQWERF